MRKYSIKSLTVALLLTLLLCFIGCSGSDDPDNKDNGTNDSDPIGNDSEVPDKGTGIIKDCNYSSTDNRLTPKSDEIVFSGQIFGEVSLTRFTYIMNRCYNCNDSSPLVISKIEIVDENGNPDPGDFAIESNPVEGTPVSLLNDEEIGIGVSFFANTWQEHVRYLRITSNDKCRPKFDIKLSGQTKPTGMIKVRTIDDSDPDDETMVFGEVIEETINRLEVHNVGKASLTIFSLSITSGRSNSSNEPGFFISESPEPGVSISPDGELEVKVGCRNDKEFPVPLTGELLVLNSDPTNYGENTEKKIILRCGPNVTSAPEAILECEPEKVSVLQWAVLDGSKSVDSDGESQSDLRYLWSFKSTPGGINLDIVDDFNRAGSPLNNDSSNRISRAAFQSKMKGVYTVRLIVINSKNVYSNPAECNVEAISDDDLMIKLFWTNKNSDLDLHLISPAGTYGDPGTSCYYWNCSPQYDGQRPDWGVPGDTKDDPFLDVDNTSGLGPETIYINKPENGTYRVIVHAYDLSKGPSTAIVKAFAHSDEVNSKQLLMTETNTCWEVFTIDVSDGDGEKKNLVYKAVEPPTAYSCERPQQ
jgi:hypothetical protein